MGRMGSKCDIPNTLYVETWETPQARTKLDVSGHSSLLPLPGISSRLQHTPINIAELPLDHSLEPPSPSLKHSGHHQAAGGGKILKFLKLRKKVNSEASNTLKQTFQPSLTTFRFQDQSRSSVSVEDVDLERYHYDSDEHSESVSTCDRHHHRSSCSDTSSSRSSGASQSFSSMTSRSSVSRPRASSFMLAGSSGQHQSGAQLMANILISIATLDEDDEYDHPSTTLDGPHESAWHQPLDDMFAAPPFAAGRLGTSSAKPNSGRNTPRVGRCSVDSHLTSPGPSRRLGKLDLSRLDKLRSLAN